MATLSCVVCRTIIGDGERFVLLRGGRQEAHCSQVCLVASVERRRRAGAALRRQWLVLAATVAFIVIGADKLWHRFHAPRPQTIAFEPPDVPPAPLPRPELPMYGPAWPPTDGDWQTAFARVAWIYPLPGPARRAPAADDHIPTNRPGAGRPGPGAVCRVPARCGVDLGGELWGEHVYAAQDGVVDRVLRGAGDERGDVYLRLSHLGGMVFTHYDHLAAVPRGIAHGAIVNAGDLIGLVGDVSNEHAHPGRYLHFALSVRASTELPEVYWDPTEMMARWPLRVPAHGTVAGFVPAESELVVPGARRRPR
jgi:murein DD-endopeptidase MepM/ murein hydrolase activator NlpD